MYEVDMGDFNIYNAYTFFGNLPEFSSLNASQSGPMFKSEYLTSDTYSSAAKWSDTDPLNAMF